MTVRGKLRHGFDFNVHVSFTATLPPTDDLDIREVKGTVQIQDASRDAVQVRLFIALRGHTTGQRASRFTPSFTLCSSV